MIRLYSVDFNKSPAQDMQDCCKSQAKLLQIFVENFQEMVLNRKCLPKNGRLGEPEMSSTTEQRRERILAEADHNGRVSVRDLALALGVSEATVRRDLKSLADDGQLDIVFGGAILPRTLDYSFPSKERRNIESKRIIGALAARLVNDGDQIFMDSGTTCGHMARYLRETGIDDCGQFDSPGDGIRLARAAHHHARWAIPSRPDGCGGASGHAGARRIARLPGLHRGGRVEHGFRALRQRY
jgi:DNA-binding transcriptional ArsR family regulator